MTTSTSPATLISLSTLSAFASGFVQLLIYLGAGILFFAPIPHVNIAGAVLVLAFSVVICAAIGLFAAGLQVAIHKGSVMLWAMSSSAWLMAGALFPVAALPRPIQTLSALLPFTHSLTAMRLTFLQGNSSANLGREIGILFLYAGLLLPVAVTFFSRAVQRARRLGTLSFY